MKTAVAAAMVLLSTLAATEPDVFYGLDAGKLYPLERQQAIVRGKAGGFMVITTKGTLELSGAKSPVRFRSGVPLEFVIHATSDPLTSYCLRRLDSKKTIREIVISSGHAAPFGASNKVNASQGVVPITVSPYGAGSYKITARNLAPGEYALSRTRGGLMFCFGVNR